VIKLPEINKRWRSDKNEVLNGKLYVVEGCDGSGKSTQIYLLKRWLESKGFIVFFTEWNSSDLIKESTSQAKRKDLLTPTTFSLMHASDFADRYEKMILPQLRAGYIVLCDRYIYTAFARDMARGCNREWVKNVYSFVIKPDIIFYFQAPLQISLNRILTGRLQLEYHESGMDILFFLA
jgi:dTMP kinase